MCTFYLIVLDREETCITVWFASDHSTLVPPSILTLLILSEINSDIFLFECFWRWFLTSYNGNLQIDGSGHENHVWSQKLSFYSNDKYSLIIVHWASELSSMWNCCHWSGICKVALHPIFCHTNYSASCLCLNCRGDSFVHWLCVWSCKVVICTPVVLQIDHRWLQIG